MLATAAPVASLATVSGFPKPATSAALKGLPVAASSSPPLGRGTPSWRRSPASLRAYLDPQLSNYSCLLFQQTLQLLLQLFIALARLGTGLLGVRLIGLPTPAS